MSVVTGSEYDHVDFTKQGVTVRHPLKDATARQTVDNVKDAVDAPEFSTTTAYPNIGTPVWRNDNLYWSIFHIPEAEQWVSQHWEKMSVSEAFASFRTKALDALVYTNGILDFLDYYRHPYIIGSANKWAQRTFRHICYPIEPNSTIEVTAGSKNTAFAFLQNDSYSDGGTPAYATEMDDGTTIPIGRTVVTANTTIKKGAPSDAHFLYITTKTETDVFPARVLINGHDLVHGFSRKNEAEVQEDEYTTVKKWDFNDASELNDFKLISNTNISPSTGLYGYDSIFMTDDETAYVDNGTLVLRCVKRNIVDSGKTFHYKGAYLSTQETFAIKEGRISARIKQSETWRDGFLWTFFTFGQNDNWRKAPEFDIAETTINNGTNGTELAKFGGHVHFLNNQDVGSTFTATYYSEDATFNNSVPTTWDYHWGRYGYSLDDWFKNWHEYAVEWDTKSVNFLIDNVIVREIDVSNITHTIWDSPADIRINLKARPWAEAEASALFVDWIKVEVKNPNACYSVSHDDVEIARGTTFFVKPIFAPDEGINAAFSLSSSNTNIIAVENASDAYERTTHQLTAIGSVGQSAEITITHANGISGTFTATIT